MIICLFPGHPLEIGALVDTMDLFVQRNVSFHGTVMDVKLRADAVKKCVTTFMGVPKCVNKLKFDRIKDHGFI